MASDKEKDMLEDEEIIDLTDVFEEGLEVDSKEEWDQDSRESTQDKELEEDLNGLFDNLDSEKDSRASESDEIEDLLRDKIHPGDKPAEPDDQQDDFLKDFLKDDQQDEMFEEQDQPEKLEPSVKSEGVEEVETHPEDSIQVEAFASEKAEPDAATAILAERLEALSDRLDSFEERIFNMENSFFEKTIETIEEKGPELAFLNKMLWEFKEDISSTIENRLDSLDTGRREPSEEDFRFSVLQVIEEKGLELGFLKEFADKVADEVKSSILVEIDERLGAIDQPEQLTPEDIKGKALEAVEEKGLELGFLKEFADKVADEVKSSILVEIDERLGSIDQPEQLTSEDIKGKALEAVEEKGLELRLIQDLKENIIKENEELIYEKFSEIIQTIEPVDGSQSGQKIQELESRIAEISVPDPEQLKEDMMAELEKLIDDRMYSLSQTPDPEEFKEDMNDIAEDRIDSFIESWKSEKQSQAKELEHALKLWGTVEQKLGDLTQDIAQLREKTAGLDLEIMKKFQSINELAVTREEFTDLATELKVELEEYILKKVPEAAARIIREEILAIISEKK